MRAERKQPTQAESRALDRSHFYAAANHRVRDFVEVPQFDRIDAGEGCDRQVVGGTHLDEEFFGIHLDSIVSVGEAVNKALLDALAQPGFAVLGHSRFDADRVHGSAEIEYSTMIKFAR